MPLHLPGLKRAELLAITTFPQEYKVIQKPAQVIAGIAMGLKCPVCAAEHRRYTVGGSQELEFLEALSLFYFSRQDKPAGSRRLPASKS